MTHNFKTTNIRGKNYVEVNERIKYFRTSPDYAGFSLSSTMIHFDADACVIQATICDAQGKVIATGYAQEDRTSSNINKTSYVENCETSAWGRALANLGIGIDTSIASSNEVSMAIAKQEKQEAKAAPKSTPKAPEVQSDEVIELYEKAVFTLEGIKDEAERVKMRNAILNKYGEVYTPQQIESLSKI